MCDEGALDNSDTFDTCNLAFSSECVVVLNARPSKDDYALSGMDDSLKNPAVNTYARCAATRAPQKIATL